MSTIGLKFHNEDIHNIIRKPMPPIIKSPRYKSKRKVTDLQSRKYNGHQTFGMAHYEAPESKNYLRRKQQGPSPIVKPINKTECPGTCKGSSIPKQISLKKKEPKNFVKENMKNVVALQPKVPIPRRVETPRGTVKDLAHLLQMIKFRESEEYGKVPKYLCVRKKKLLKERERQQLERMEQEYREKTTFGTTGMGENVYMIDQEARQQILDGLKENWNELSKQFLKLPVMTDTWPKIKRKMFLEKEIDQLEKDIKLVESHPYIYLERYPIINREPSKVKLHETEKEQQKEEKPEEEVEKEETEKKEVVEEKKDEDKEINVHNY